MRALLILVGAVALAAYLFTEDPFGSPEPERCPGGICPTPEHSSLPTIDRAEITTTSLVTPVLPAPSQPQLQPKAKFVPLTAAPSASPKSVRGPEGWRLRLFYPLGSSQGEALKKKISAMKAICVKYGFDANTTDGEVFEYWKDQVSANNVTLVLVHPDNRVVYKESQHIPTDPIELREALRAAALNSWKGSK